MKKYSLYKLGVYVARQHFDKHIKYTWKTIMNGNITEH